VVMWRSAFLAAWLVLAAEQVTWAQSNVTIYVHSDNPGLSIPPDFVGLSLETVLLTGGNIPFANPAYQQMVSQIAPGLLRIGGDSGDQTIWSGGTRTSNTPTNVLTRTDVDAVMSFARTAGWKVLLQLNLATSNANADAAEADYVSRYSDVLYGFEIGNEPDLYPANGDRLSNYTLSDYLSQWNTYATAVTSSDSSALFSGPATAGNISTWTAEFATQYGSRIALLTHHWYPLGPPAEESSVSQGATIPNLLSAQTHSEADSIGAQLQTIAQSANVPWRMSETNSSFNGQTGVSDVFASALWATDYMFALASRSAAGVNFHGGGNAPYAPIALEGGVVMARPLYYALLFFQAAAHGRLLPIDLNSSDVNLNAYALLDADGTLRVAIINEDLQRDASVQITPGSEYTSGLAMRLNAPSLQSTSPISLGGSTLSADGAWSPEQLETVVGSAGAFAVTVPAGSAVLVGFGGSSLGISNAASAQPLVASNSIATAYGQNLGFATRAPSSEVLPTSLAGVSAVVTDAAGVAWTAPLFYVSPSQVNLLIPTGVALGTAQIAIGRVNGRVQVAPTAPGLFAIGTTNIAAATAARYPTGGGPPSSVSVFDCGTGTCVATPIQIDNQSTVFLSLYGTGFDVAPLSTVECMVNGTAVPVEYIGPQNQFTGLDQINVALPAGLRGLGAVNIVLTIAGRSSNAVQIILGG